MTALAESHRSRRPLLEMLAVELASREGRWAAVARIAIGSAITVVIAMVFQNTPADLHGVYRLSDQQR